MKKTQILLPLRPALSIVFLPALCQNGSRQEATRLLATDRKKMPIELDERDIRERFIRGSGPGGQAINKLSTNVELVHIPTSTRITCQLTRSRAQNRELARRQLSQRLEWLIKQNWSHVSAQQGTKPVSRELSPSVIQSNWDKARKRKQNKRKKQRRRASNESVD